MDKKMKRNRLDIISYNQETDTLVFRLLDVFGAAPSIEYGLYGDKNHTCSLTKTEEDFLAEFLDSKGAEYEIVYLDK